MTEWFGWLVCTAVSACATVMFSVMSVVMVCLPFVPTLAPLSGPLWVRVLAGVGMAVLMWPLIPMLTWRLIVMTADATAHDWRAFRETPLSFRDIASGALALCVLALCGACVLPLVLALGDLR